MDLFPADLLQRGQGHLVMGRAEVLEDLTHPMTLLNELDRAVAPEAVLTRRMYIQTA